MFNDWDVNAVVGQMPQEIATAFGKLNEMVGAEYTPLAYIGKQIVNGENHAVLAEQAIVTGKDTRNIVLVIFNVKPDGVTLVNIERIVEGGGELGGIQIGVKSEIPEDAGRAFDAAFAGYVGARVNPFLLLATQVTKGTNYIFAAEIVPATENPVKKFALVVVESMTNCVAFVEPLTSKTDVFSLGYAFTWLQSQNTSAGRQIGEWA